MGRGTGARASLPTLVLWASSAALLAACQIGAAPAGPRAAGPRRSPHPPPARVATLVLTATIPAGWIDRSTDSREVERFSGSGYVEALLEEPPRPPVHPRVDDLTAAIAVVRLRDGPIPDPLLAGYLSDVSGGVLVRQPEPVTVGGEMGQAVTFTREVGGTPAEARDIAVGHGGATYEITLSTSRANFPRQSADLASLLASWRWATPPAPPPPPPG